MYQVSECTAGKEHGCGLSNTWCGGEEKEIRYLFRPNAPDGNDADYAEHFGEVQWLIRCR
jgi:hypothetical protein